MRRYHKEWFEVQIEAMKVNLKEEFEKNPASIIRCPLLLPMCQTFNKEFPMGGWTDYCFNKDVITGEIILDEEE